ncbi:MAG: hypothetical protein SFY96_10585 [Planctomycetota bacterium]|nr:hypothetical protein [Planctomycetota bacterium]
MELTSLNLQSADEVVRLLRAGAEANRAAPCRHGSIDIIAAPGRLIATGDLHDNPLHLSKLVRAARLDVEDGATDDADGNALPHITLHEIIHSPRLLNGMDFSYRALTRVAALKAAFPTRVHTLLGNHELAQVQNAGIIKDGVRSVDVFNDAVEYAFGDDAPRVLEAVGEFVYSMPIALRCHCVRSDGHAMDILCAHSLPGPAMMNRFDPTLLSRPLRAEDYEPRVGSAHQMIWGRGYDAEQLEDLVERWGVNLFVLGHEKAENGIALVPPNAIVLASDHERGVYLPIDLSDPPRPEQCFERVVSLAEN